MNTKASNASVGMYRWWICGLLFIATTINYVDRNALSVLKTKLQDELHWTDVDYGWITFAFTLAYAAFPSVIGRAIDRWGVKVSLAAALVLWSLMAAAHGLVATVFGFVIVRFFLGLAEAANFPASIKAVAMWFPQQERALATGLFNSGTSLGVMISFATVMLANAYGWQAAFVTIGVLGFIWLIFWQRSFHAPEQHPALSPEELNYIRSGLTPPSQSVKLPWTALLRFREIWPFIIGKLITDPVWWFYLFWLPSYLDRERGQNPLDSALIVGVIYTGSMVGSIAGGWLSGKLIQMGWTVGRARMLTMLLAAVCMPGSIVAYYTESFAVCVVLISLATACHQAWSANLFTSATDLFPAKVSGAVVGLGATAGGIGSMFMTLNTALLVQWTGNQQIVFLLAGVMHPLSLLIFWLWLRGRFDQVDTDTPRDMSRVHGPLALSGAGIALVGALLTIGIALYWEVLVQAVKLPGAAQAATVSGGVCLIGLALVYAGLPQRRVITTG